MSRFSNSKFLNISVVLVFFLGGGLGFAIGSDEINPLNVVRHYPISLLAEEASGMVECVECHEAQEFHTCQTCHDDHGAIELVEVPFYNWIFLTGDVPEAGFVEINEILPYREQPNTMISVIEFLEQQGVEQFEKVGLFSDDGGVVIIEQSQLTDEAYLMPYKDGIRFACEDLHVSTWIKGIKTIVVVGSETDLTINGEKTSLGRLWMGPVRTVQVEAANVMFVSEVDGQMREAVTATLMKGIALEDILDLESLQGVEITDQDGNAKKLTLAEAQTGLLVPIRGVLTLVFPDRGRAQWIENVVQVESIL